MWPKPPLGFEGDERKSRKHLDAVTDFILPFLSHSPEVLGPDPCCDRGFSCLDDLNMAFAVNPALACQDIVFLHAERSLEKIAFCDGLQADKNVVEVLVAGETITAERHFGADRNAID